MVYLIACSCSTYNPEDGRGSRKPATRQQAMAELAEVVKTIKPDNFEPTIITQSDDYLYAEFQVRLCEEHNCCSRC